MVGQNYSKYHGVGICCIAIYNGILYNIGILCRKAIRVRLYIYIYIYIYIYMYVCICIYIYIYIV